MFFLSPEINFFFRKKIYLLELTFFSEIGNYPMRGRNLMRALILSNGLTFEMRYVISRNFQGC